MMERIPEARTDNIPQTTNTYYIHKKEVTAESIINKALWTILVLLVISVLATFFVEDLPEFVLDLRALAVDGIWIAVCCYSIGEVLKRIFQNRGKGTEEYKKAKEEAHTALMSLTPDELAHRDKYCKWYEENAYNRVVERELANIGIDKDVYFSQYAVLSKRELKKRHKNKLTDLQIKELAKINKIEREEYNSFFFLTEEHIAEGMSPSQMYNTRKADTRNMISSAITSLATCLCAISFTGNLCLAFSLSVLFSAIVKITVTAVFGAFKARFGWNLSMVMDVGRFHTQVKEVSNLKKWYKDTYGNREDCIE